MLDCDCELNKKTAYNQQRDEILPNTNFDLQLTVEFATVASSTLCAMIDHK